MEDWYLSAVNDLESYVNSFTGLSPEQKGNFTIKKNHSLRVAANSRQLAVSLNLTPEEEQAVVLTAIYHDIGRFRQIAEHNTLNDAVSVDHAQLATEIIREKGYLNFLSDEMKEDCFKAIHLHNKFALPGNLSEKELLHARLLRDADKLDILKVLSTYYINKNNPVNHMLTWDLPKSSIASPAVIKEIMAGKLVSRKEVKNETDVKLMQLSWVYDINFKTTIGMILRNRYLENIYNSLPKNDQIFEVYRKIKVFAENKMM